MRATSLLTLDQLDTIFMNLDELMHVHRQLMDRLTHALTEAQQQGDQVRQWNTW